MRSMRLRAVVRSMRLRAVCSELQRDVHMRADELSVTAALLRERYCLVGTAVTDGV